MNIYTAPAPLLLHVGLVARYCDCGVIRSMENALASLDTRKISII